MNKTNELEGLHEKLMVILKEIDRICKIENINYTLIYGSALGAVRHQGFIPWDDDLDIAMCRDDYNKFINICENYLDYEIFCLEKEYSETWTLGFSKLHLRNTTFIESFDLKINHCQGIFVDIFPLDDVIEYGIFTRIRFKAAKILSAKGIMKKGLKIDSINSLLKFFIGKGLFIFNETLLKKIAYSKPKKKTKYVANLLTEIPFEKRFFLKEDIKETKRIIFEDGLFPVSNNIEKYLKQIYGDYMILPSLEEQNSLMHALIIDPDKPYTEYL